MVLKSKLNGQKKTTINTWGQNEAEKQLIDAIVYGDVSSNKEILTKLSEASNKMFGSLKRKCLITEKQLKYFTYEYKKKRVLANFDYFPKFMSNILMSPGDL